MDRGKDCILARRVKPLTGRTSQPAQRAKLKEAIDRIRPFGQASREAAALAKAEPDNVEERDGGQTAARGERAKGEDACVTMNRARRVISWCGFAEQLSSHLPFLLGHLPEVQRCQRFQVMDGEQPVIGPFGHWIADQHKSFQVLAGPQVVDLREVLNPIGHEQQVLQRWQVLAESVNILDPVAIGDDGAQPIKIGEVVEGLQLILAEIDALIVVLHQGRSTSVAAVLLMADKPLPRKVSSR